MRVWKSFTLVGIWWHEFVNKLMEERRLLSPSDKGLKFETLAFQIFHRGDSTFINSFDKTKFSCLKARWTRINVTSCVCWWPNHEAGTSTIIKPKFHIFSHRCSTTVSPETWNLSSCSLAFFVFKKRWSRRNSSLFNHDFLCYQRQVREFEVNVLVPELYVDLK